MSVTDDDTAGSTTEVTSNEEMTQAPAVSDCRTASVAVEPARRTASGSVLLFSGKHGIEGSLKQQFESSGVVVVDYDTANGPNYNIADDFIWDPLLKRVEDGTICSQSLLPLHAGRFLACGGCLVGHHRCGGGTGLTGTGYEG